MMTALLLLLLLKGRTTRAFRGSSLGRLRVARVESAVVEIPSSSTTQETPPPTEKTTYSLRLASTESDFEAGATLCGKCFPTTTAQEHGKVLRSPNSLANVFFDVAGEASLAVAFAEDAMACAQVVPCVVRAEASAAFVGRRAFWVQYVCVEESWRRRGVARDLMSWVEDEVAVAAHRSKADAADIWLAARVDAAPAIALYRSLGFAESADSGPPNLVVMRKSVKAADASSSGDMRGKASAFDVLVAEKNAAVSWSAVVDQVGPRALFAFVAALGFFALLVPFSGTSAFVALQTLLLPPTALQGAIHVQMGLVAAAMAELYRRRFLADDERREDEVPSSTASKSEKLLRDLRQDASLAAQKESLWRISGGASAPALETFAAIFVWQTVACVSEELYYRGLLLNGVKRFVHFLGAPPLLPGLVGLVLSTAVFSLAHADWVDSEQPDSQAQRLDWLTHTAPFGALFGLLFLLANDSLLAPFVCHLACNLYWLNSDLDDLRQAPRAQLAAIFDDRSRPTAASSTGRS
mmetsp:Transcript_3140/g.9577  ORF Transcript_3140/g.9577 Transcript_3140/m.9577 type:complete len:524 (+) Transcript_3140:59-1630(+)